MSKSITIKLDKKEAEALGLLVCGSCGYPRNNHFSFGKKLCAHSNECKGYKEVSRAGHIIKRR